MGTGYLKVEVHTAYDALPIPGATVIVSNPNGRIIHQGTTDESGETGTFRLSAPDKQYTLMPNYKGVPYSTYNVVISAPGYVTRHISGIYVEDGETSILTEELTPLSSGNMVETDEYIDVPQHALLSKEPHLQAVPPPPAPEAGENVMAAVDPPPMAANAAGGGTIGGGVRIPEFITVHLGHFSNTSARNVRVRFADYIKNVTSHEIYATWPRNSILANIHAIVTFTLNRIYTEWYRSRGYNFDITNSTRNDMMFVYGGQVFQNISQIVDQVFNTYVRRIGFEDPFFTEFCNGTTATCPGMSQWGSVTLANRGLSPLEILRSYYPRDVELITSNNIGGIAASYPGTALRLGSSGDPVRRMQNMLNRVRVNFPAIPRIENPNGTFDAQTDAAVRAFQRTFNMTVDGVVGPATWNRINFIFVAVTDLAELTSEGVRNTIGERPPNVVLRSGSRGRDVLQLQFILNIVSRFYPEVPSVIEDGVFDARTLNSVREFQRRFGLNVDGIVGPLTWGRLYDVYRGIDRNTNVPHPPVVTPPGTPSWVRPPYPGVLTRQGSRGENVRIIQSYLNAIGRSFQSIPPLNADGIFGPLTDASVRAFQREFGLVPDGIVGPITWNKIFDVYEALQDGSETIPPVTPPPTPPPVTPPPPGPFVPPPYPGTLIRQGARGDNVRLMQIYLTAISRVNSNVPALTADGIFGPLTDASVRAFQRQYGLNPDGIIGPLTWNRIVEVYASILAGNPIAPTTPPPAPPNANRPYPGVFLRNGSRGDDVRFMQQALVDLRALNPNLPLIAVDGIFGPRTEEAIRAFQSWQGLVADGIIGPITWYAILDQRNLLV